MTNLGLIFVVLILICGGYFLGFGAGIKFTFDKMHKVFDYETYRNIVNAMHEERYLNEEEK